MQEKFDFLEAFWDSAVPRFGEDGAKGWGHWVQSKGEVPFVSMYDADIDEVIEEKILSCDNDRSETWSNLEKSRMSRHWLPWRPNVRDGETEEDCEDPERLIMFDDISSLIFEIESVDNKLALIISLLALIGIDQDKITSNKFPSQSVLSHMIQQYELESFCDINVGGVLDDPHLVHCCSNVEINREGLSKFSENILHQATQQFDGHSKTRLTLLSINLRAARIKSEEDELKKDKKLWKNSCKELKRWIKDILKEEANRNNVLLWEAYAETEEMLGNKDDNMNVLDTILSMNILPGGILKVKDNNTLCQICKLCRNRVENEMGIHKPRQSRERNINRERTLHVLSSLADNEQYAPLKNNSTVPSTKVLRARRNYQSLVDNLLQNEEDDTDRIVNVLPEAGSSLVHTVVCFAYFQYLTVDVHAATVVFQQCVASVKSKHQTSRQSESGKGGGYFDVTQFHQQKVLEKLTEAHISLLEYHIDVEASPMRILRIPLQQALHEYPDNVQLLMAFAKLESRGGIRGQLRRKLHDVAKLASTPAVWLSAIIAELRSIHRLKDHHSYMLENYKMLSGFRKELIVEPSTKHQLRAWFEKALDQSPNRQCILLWRLYMYTEAEFGEKFAAKAVFYRAVQQCPRAKIIYMDFVHYFPDKLQEVVDLLVEKELRVRMPLEELDLLLANKENIIANQTDDRDKQGDVVQ